MTTEQQDTRKWYVMDLRSTDGPYTYEEGKAAQDRANARYGIDKDGEGYCNALLLTEDQVRYLGKMGHRLFSK